MIYTLLEIEDIKCKFTELLNNPFYKEWWGKNNDLSYALMQTFELKYKLNNFDIFETEKQKNDKYNYEDYILCQSVFLTHKSAEFFRNIYFDIFSKDLNNE